MPKVRYRIQPFEGGKRFLCHCSGSVYFQDDYELLKWGKSMSRIDDLNDLPVIDKREEKIAFMKKTIMDLLNNFELDSRTKVNLLYNCASEIRETEYWGMC